MITNKELNEISLSPTKKDYYQIWNEIIDLASKISARWSPDSTNESDPGIVLLKSLVAIADKLNYNIDKNTLEAFMPSATQVESMRKLTEMMGYTMKHYQAATCTVSISYKDSNETSLDSIGSIYFPKFINLKNEEEDVNYVTLEEFTLQASEPVRQIQAIEGELIECETNTDNIITLIHLDDNNRYFLPEVNVAENAIFVSNIVDVGGVSRESEPWRQVDNLNVQLPGTCVYKFGFDSVQNLPYIQFPDDISQLIKDGLKIKYIRTSGINGNISARVLCKLEVPAIWNTAEEGSPIRELTADNFSITNISASMNGTNPESITAAYNNYKKVIGTFDTLVTCRDYMNKIYQLTKSETDTTPLVSNIIVSDIRDDINKAITLCSFDEYGICYSDVSRVEQDSQNNDVDAIEHFDLVLYPFKTIYGLNTYDEYVNSFRINYENVNRIKYDLNNFKTISHNFVVPEKGEIACIKNYLKLKASIVTVKKVTLVEEREILNNIYTAIYKNFNCHQIDFGEEIPYDSIVEVIKNADTRIKDINLDEPSLYTTILDCDGSTEYELVATADGGVPSLSGDGHGNALYNKLVLRNILAGKIAAFQYDNDFKTDYADMPYETGTIPESGETETYAPKYPDNSTLHISRMQTEFLVRGEDHPDGLELNENEAIQFRMPNLKTTVTYPCYVNYFIKLNLPSDAETKIAVPATFISLNDYLRKQWTEHIVGGETKWAQIANNDNGAGTDGIQFLKFENMSEVSFNSKKKEYGAIFTKNTNDKYVLTDEYAGNDKTYYAIDLADSTNFSRINRYITRETYNDKPTNKLEGIFRSLGADLNRTPGRYVDIDSVKYMQAYKPNTITNFFVQYTHPTTIPDPDNPGEVIPNPDLDKLYTENGLGRDADYPTIGKDAEYQLSSGEYLLINYTDSQTDSSGNEKKTVVNKYWGEGTIIKPNFAIVDSELYHNNHTYSKKDGYYFERYPNCPGMFTLATEEQICIREIVKIDLDEDITYLYWERNDEPEDELIHIFTFDEYYYDTRYEKEGYHGGIPNPNYGKPDHEGEAEYLPNAYTLKDGEHLYYTNAKKTDLAYYGSGTLIIQSENTPVLKKNTQLGVVSEEEIMTYGIAAAIPWGTAYRLSKNLTLNQDRKITVIENQYISLTEGDTLFTISNTTANTSTFDLDLDNNWREVTSATYRFAEDENGTTTNLPTVRIKGLNWYVRSRLDLNMTPSNPQVLHAGDSITLEFKNKSGDDTKTVQDTIKLEPLIHDGETKVTPLAIYSNYSYNCAYDNVQVLVNDLKLKLVKLHNPTIGSGDVDTAAVNLDNYANSDATFTKFAFETVIDELKDITKPVFSLNVNLLDNKFGLVMFYYIDELAGKAGHNNARIEVETDGTDGAGVRVFNYVTSGKTRQQMPISDHYNFTPGIKVLEFTPGVTKIKVYADYTGIDAGKSYQSILIFSDLDLVKDINPKLNYRFEAQAGQSNAGKALEQMLTDIRNTKIADDFYYNTPINKSNAIELNTYVDTDTLASPTAWYDSNNTNNKFVVSEIDAEYLPIGITLTRASRL